MKALFQKFYVLIAVLDFSGVEVGEIDHVLDSEAFSVFEVSGDAHQIQKADRFCAKM